MLKPNYQIIWTSVAKDDLNRIYRFIKIKSLIGAKNVVSDIREAPKSILFSKQTSVELYNPKYRSIIIRNYKILYRVNTIENILYVVGVFHTNRDPNDLTQY